jgi:aspartyl-tRNA(Asn)/glutamyl-tRNA(Gln) amidotransferase subunit B
MIKIGLEIHGYIDTKEKLFCNCNAIHGAKLTKPNTNICPVCTGQPGAKPMATNKEALNKAIQIALILGCKINKNPAWQRKHYSWPDLPKGYQNTLSGPHAIPTGENGEFRGIKIRECHLEEDPAAWNPKTGEIDYNRSGIPLIEIVTEPDFKDSTQVSLWLKDLMETLSHIKSIDKKLGIKSDVNVSIKESGFSRIEIKNVNSIKNIKNVIDIEISRQQKEHPKEQETRRYDPEKGKTSKMRSKENAEEYRFISDPDLPTINLTEKRITNVKTKTPETPFEKLEKIIKKHKIQKSSAEILTKNIDVIDLFENTIKKINKNLSVRWITEELFSVLNYNKKELEDLDLNQEHFIELLKLIEENKISELKAKEILRSWKEKSFSPLKEIGKHKQISNKGEMDKIIKEIIQKNKQAVDDYRSGKKWAINFLIGKVMEKTNKRADYKITKELLIKELS